MMPPELNPRSFRPNIYPSMSAPSFSSSFNGRDNRNTYNYASPDKTPNPSRSRFAPSPFLYNARVALALVPCAAFLLDLGGAPVVAILTVGLMISYFLDSLSFKPASFFSIWLSLLFSQLTFFFLNFSFPSLPLSLLSSLLCAFVTFLVGTWASLQFKWIHLENPSITLSLERLLFACIPLAAPAIFSWAVISAVGMKNSSYYLMTFHCLFYYLFSIPRVSSFKSKSDGYHGGELPDEMLILTQVECCFHTLNMLFFPVIFHVASHYSVAISSVGVSDCLLLFFIPFLFMLYCSTRGSLWWASKNHAQLHSIRVVNGAVALIVVVICLEVRVVFHSFGKYIQVPAPLNYLLVTVTMLGGAAGSAAYALGMVSDAFSSVVFTALAVVVSAAGAVIVGFPPLFLPLPTVSGFYLARFFTKKSLPSYFAFVVLGSLMVMWFVMHNFWDLNVWMAGMSLKSFCKLIVANVVLAMAVPGLALLPSKLHFLTEIGLSSHALLLCHIENRFFNYSNIYYYGLEDEVMYPSYMVIITTFVGLAMVRRLFVDQRIGPKAAWVLTCLYSSKLAMLFVSSKSVVWMSAILLLAVSPPVLLYKEKSRTSSKMKAWQGYAHAGVVAVSVWFCRETIFEALQWWYGKSPSDGLLLGSCIMLIGLACMPIVVLHFSHVMSAKRCLVLVVATGLLFIFMQPPIPLSLTYHSDVIKAARQSTDDISIYGFVASKPTWPSWLLIAAILLTLASVTSIIPIKYIVELRAIYSIALGITLGVYISAEYFMQVAILHALIVVTMVCASVFVVFTHFPSASSPKLLPWVFALLVALLPITYLLEGELRFKDIFGGSAIGDIAEEDSKLTTLLAVEGSRTSLLGLYAAIFMLVALEIKFELASLMQEKASERRGPGHIQSVHSSSATFPPRMRFIQRRRAWASTVSTCTIRKMVAEAEWMPGIGNTATLLCFAICLILNVSLTGGSNRAIFFLAPILLLLNQDAELGDSFGDKQRYFPVTVAISVYLVATAIYSIWEDVWYGNGGWGLEIGGPDWVFAVKNLALLILTLPSHIVFNKFVWGYTKQSNTAPLLTLPLNLPSVIITDVLKIRILGFLGITYSIAQYLISRQQYITGLKYI